MSGFARIPSPISCTSLQVMPSTFSISSSFEIGLPNTEIPGELPRSQLAAFKAHEKAGLDLSLGARQLLIGGAVFRESANMPSDRVLSSRSCWGLVAA